MDFDSSSKFIASLAKFLQSLCNGYVEFDKGVEVIGHIYLSVDSDTGKKIDYVLNEKVCKNDNSVTFISNSFHAQPAEKPKPPSKKTDAEKRNEDSVVLDDSGQTVPSSTNVGTIATIRIGLQGNQDGSFSPGGKRPRSPHRRGSLSISTGRPSGSPSLRPGMSPRYDSGGPANKMGRSDSSFASAYPSNSSEDYDGGGGFQDDDDSYTSNFLNQDDQSSSQDVDQKPIIDPDISIVKEEHMASQQAHPNIPPSYSGPGRGRPSPAPYSMMHQNPSTSMSSHAPDTYSGSSLEGADPSTFFSLASGNKEHLSELKPTARRRRFADSNEMYTMKQKEEIGRYALAYGASQASRHYSDLYGKRIPRSSVQNFINALRKGQLL